MFKQTKDNICGQNTIRGLILSAALAFLAACSGGSDGADEEQIANALALRLSAGMTVTSVETQVSENRGTQVEPDIQARSLIEIRFTEDFYVRQGRLGGVDIVTRSFSKGDVVKGTAITSSTLNGERWDVAFERIDLPPIAGEAESLIGPGFVVQGSDAHEALIAKVEAERQQAAEEARKKAEQEEQQRTARIADFHQAITGTWAARYPAFHNGQMWVGRNGGKMGIQLHFDGGDGAVGQGSGVLYDFENPIDELVVPIGYKVDDGGEFLTLNFTQNVEHRGLRFSVGPRGTWKMGRDGKLSFSGYNNNWTLELEKDGPVLANRSAQIEAHRAEQKRRESLALKHNAANATRQFEDLPLNQNTFGLFMVVGDDEGDVWGEGIYHEDSNVAAAAVHAGLLRPGQAGVLKINYHYITNRSYSFEGTTRNGVTSNTSRGTYGRYTIELVEALNANE
ncbi:MAG: hypothetical protein Tsb0016_16400 [Sphingomonadales bacterium]